MKRIFIPISASLLLIAGCSDIKLASPKMDITTILTNDDSFENVVVIKKRIIQKILKNSLFDSCSIENEASKLCIEVKLSFLNSDNHYLDKMTIEYKKNMLVNDKKNGSIDAIYPIISRKCGKRAMCYSVYENLGYKDVLLYSENEEDKEKIFFEDVLESIKENQIIKYESLKSKSSAAEESSDATIKTPDSNETIGVNDESLLQSIDINVSKEILSDYQYSGYGYFSNSDLLLIRKDAINLHDIFVPYRLMEN